MICRLEEAPAATRRADAMQSTLISQAHPATNRCCAVPSSRRSIVSLPAAVSRSLLAVAAHAIGFAEPRHNAT